MPPTPSGWSLARVEQLSTGGTSDDEALHESANEGSRGAGTIVVVVSPLLGRIFPVEAPNFYSEQVFQVVSVGRFRGDALEALDRDRSL